MAQYSRRPLRCWPSNTSPTRDRILLAIQSCHTKFRLCAACIFAFILVCHNPAYADESSTDASPIDVAKKRSVQSASRITKPNIVYAEAEGVPLLADFYRPAGEQRLPIVLLIHGGGWITGTRHQIAIHGNRLNAAGFAVLSIEYRLAPRFKFPAQLDDVRSAIRYLDSNAKELNVDIDQLVIWGYSAGGHLAALAATNPCDGVPRPKVCVAGGAPCDFTILPENNSTLAPFLGGSRKEIPQIYADASPTSHASQDDPPTFFFHGDSDLLVPDSNSARLFEKLKECKVPADRFIVKGQGHMTTFINLPAVDAAISFVQKHLATNTPSAANETSAP